MSDNPQFNRLKAKLLLDPLELDRELIELPMLMMEATEICAEKLFERDKAKNTLDVMIAEVGNNLRSHPISDSKGGHKQRSEAQIESETPLYSGVQNAQELLENAKGDLALWQALVDSIRTKRDTLKTFCELTISGYLSPNVALDKRRAEIRVAGSKSGSNGMRRRPMTTQE